MIEDEMYKNIFINANGKILFPDIRWKKNYSKEKRNLINLIP